MSKCVNLLTFGPLCFWLEAAVEFGDSAKTVMTFGEHLTKRLVRDPIYSTLYLRRFFMYPKWRSTQLKFEFSSK